MFGVEVFDLGPPTNLEATTIAGELDVDRLASSMLDESDQHFAHGDLDVLDLINTEASERCHATCSKAQDPRERWVGRDPYLDRTEMCRISHGCSQW